MGRRSLFLLCFLTVLPLYSEAESTPSVGSADRAPLEWETRVEGPNVTEGCQRLPGGGECSTTGCPDGFTCSAAPGDTCACIKPCGKVSLDRCEGGCAPGKVCDKSGNKCACIDLNAPSPAPVEGCKSKPFATPNDPQGRACGGECPPGLVCVKGGNGCVCEKSADPKGTCKLVPNNGEPYCEGNCPSGSGQCYPVIDDAGEWKDCTCQATCQRDAGDRSECREGVCLFGHVCNYKDADSTCNCTPIIPTPTPTPGGAADCGIYVSGILNEEDSIDKLTAESLRRSGLTVTCKLVSGQCSPNQGCKFSDKTHGDCGCR